MLALELVEEAAASTGHPEGGGGGGDRLVGHGGAGERFLVRCGDDVGWRRRDLTKDLKWR